MATSSITHNFIITDPEAAERLAMSDICDKLAEAEEDARTGKLLDAAASLDSLRAKYNV